MADEQTVESNEAQTQSSAPQPATSQSPAAVAPAPAQPAPPTPPAKAPEAQVDVKALADKVQALTQQLQIESSRAADLDKQLKTATEARTKLQNANEQINQQFSQLQAQFNQAQEALAAKDGEAVNWQTQFTQLNEQFAAATQEIETAQQQLRLYEMIKDTPEYRPLIGMIDGIKVADDAAEQKKILDAVTAGLESFGDRAIAQFRDGGLPPTPAGDKKPEAQAPTTVNEVFVALQNTDPRINPGQYTALQGQLMALQNQTEAKTN